MLKQSSPIALLARVLAAGLLLAVGQIASAGIVIDVGSHDLLPNTAGQKIEIRVSTDASDLVEGCNLNASIGGGGAALGGVDGPAITAVDLVTGTIFADNNSGQDDLDSVSQLVMYSILTESGTVLADGLLVTLTIDTTGYTALGLQWELALGTTLNGPTDFAPTAATIYDGSIRLLAQGDANRDGVVDISDLSIMGTYWNDGASNHTWADGDFNGDGLVNGGDLLILSANWGWGASPAPPMEGIPEPATMSLLGLGAVALIRRSQRPKWSCDARRAISAP